MKRKISFLLIVLIILFNYSVVLATDKVAIDNKINADSNFYFLDRFGEKIHLFFVSGMDKAELKLMHAYERLLEAAQMLEKDDMDRAGELFKEAVNDFSSAVKIAANSAVDDKEFEETKKKVIKAIGRLKKDLLKNKLFDGLNL
ncbi:hypothetical protein Halha_1345 [Halobacteroides halobius DSM 5150]|uniref:DUF5667 domain-containing protein n=1 Tax=Halobacteroides halobius (strain ATCC 35273 / DSM 5150 / MD-1) TaxID=748449 RepID=L0K9V1_HALHC|nr:DUF5667 domain-containing protein [Halobacteroides halobius]AGB41290.1 hypothetical protein Halha_1345 [Halobacteroides halobius DSM 5150]